MAILQERLIAEALHNSLVRMTRTAGIAPLEHLTFTQLNMPNELEIIEFLIM